MRIVGTTRIGTWLIELSSHEIYSAESIEISLEDRFAVWMESNEVGTLEVAFITDTSTGPWDRLKQGHGYSARTQQLALDIMSTFPVGALEHYRKLHEERYGKRPNAPTVDTQEDKRA